ncbi:MAG: UDP-N-acetylmuramoyl-L-alanine--D-glutamate ligase [Methanosphaera sp.]|nr:UDP-N-acetylmuramoyl-L-alanine--D-glutamate ligase [Methanosphaera sp.]
MNISVVGLGVEGQKATISLLKHGYNVYSSDINREINLSLLEEEDLIDSDNLELEIGSHNLDKILKSDAVSVSPSLFKKKITGDIIEKGIFLSDVLNKHKNITTIAVTGTNGKTTTSHMIYHVLKNEGYRVALGGNGGGGFLGYTDLVLEANSGDYDYLVIEVCDMTLAYCSYVFNIDVVVTTNIGYDHMDVHGSIDDYTHEIAMFVRNKPAILNSRDDNLMKITASSSDALLFDVYKYPLNLFGRFNRQNASAAQVCCEYLGVDRESIKKSLESFKAVEGRTIQFNYNTNKIVSGKTDNINALKAVLSEEKFPILIIGTPRENEIYRYQILDYINDYEADTLIIFPGLEDTTYNYAQYLNELGYTNDVLILKHLDDIIRYINSQRNTSIFIGGNGQERITEITNTLKKGIINN